MAWDHQQAQLTSRISLPQPRLPLQKALANCRTPRKSTPSRWPVEPQRRIFCRRPHRRSLREYRATRSSLGKISTSVCRGSQRSQSSQTLPPLSRLPPALPPRWTLRRIPSSKHEAPKENARTAAPAPPASLLAIPPPLHLLGAQAIVLMVSLLITWTLQQLLRSLAPSKLQRQ